MMESGEDVQLDAGQRGRVILAVLLAATGRAVLVAVLAALSLVLPPIPLSVAPFCASVLLSVASAQRLKEAGRRGRRWFPERGTPVSGEDLERIRKERERRTVIFPGAGRKGKTAVCVWTKAGRIIV